MSAFLRRKRSRWGIVILIRGLSGTDTSSSGLPKRSTQGKLSVIGDDMEAGLVDATMDIPLFEARRDSLINADVRMDSFYFLPRRLLLYLIGMKYTSVSTKTSVLRKMSILILWFTSSVNRLFSMAYLRTTSLHQQKDRKLCRLAIFPVLPIAIIQNTEKKVFKTPKRFCSKHRIFKWDPKKKMGLTPRKNRLRLL